jgi:hypothetical protein
MFKRGKAQPSGAIDLADQVAQLGDAREVLRVFVPRQDSPPVGGVFVAPYEGFTPLMFGILLADIVHHGAKAYAYALGHDEAVALSEISQGLAAELGHPTDEVRQVLPGAGT